MKTNTILFLVGSVIIIGGGALAFVLTSAPTQDDAAAKTEVVDVTMTAESETMTGSGSIFGLMSDAKGESMECTFLFTDEGIRSEGAGFFMDGKARVDTLYTDVSDGQIASYMIMDTPLDSMYLWTLVDGEQSGMKMSILENEKMADSLLGTDLGEAVVDTPQQISPDTNVQYTCKPWIPDTTVFTPPTDVKFTDMSEMYQMMGDMMGGMTVPSQ